MALPKFEEVLVSNLLLDNENPRHDPIDNEAEIIAQLVRTERVVPLARSIAKEKGTSPFENIGVLPHPAVRGHFLVVEGNRRVCALKLLRDPAKAPTPTLRRTFADLKSQAGRLPDKVHVVKFKSAEEANLWIGIRHQGEQGGVGTRPWTPEGKARHAAKMGGNGGANHLAVALLDYASQSKLITPEERSAIGSTTITRYLSNPLVRDALGLASNRELLTNAPAVEFDRAVKVFLKDAVPRPGEEAPVNSRTKSKQREAYAAELRRKGHATKTRLTTPVVPVASPSPSKRKRNNRSADKRPHVVPPDFTAHIRNPILKRLFDELREIDPHEFSFAAAYLLRAFIEQLAHRYAAEHNLGSTGELHVVIGRCVTHLEKQGHSEKVLGPLRTMSSDRNSRISPETLGHWIHASEVPTRAEILRRWDSLEAALRAMLDGLK